MPRIYYPQIRIILPEAKRAEIPTWKRYDLVPIPRYFRSFMPPLEIPFDLDTDIGAIETWMASAGNDVEIGDPLGGTNFSAGMGEWFYAHRKLKPGDGLIITRYSRKHYRLDVE